MGTETHEPESRKKRKWTLRLAAGAALFMAALAQGQDRYHGGLLFSAKLDGAQEVPAVAGDAKGLIGFKLNETRDTILICGAVTGVKSAITKIHIHKGERGVAGPVAVDLMPLLKGNSISAAWTGFSRQDVANLMRGVYYVNVHTASFPNGELRGQVELEKNRQFTIELQGAAEVPAVATPASGVAVLSISPDDSVLRVQAAFPGLASAITAFHIHVGAPGTNGDMVANLTDSVSGDGLDAHVRIGSLANPGAFLDSLKKGSVYLNIHTKAHVTGELRGYSKEETERVFIANMQGENEVPAVTTPAKGLGFFRLGADDSTLVVRAAFSGLTDSITKAHLHVGASGVAGAMVADLSGSAAGNSVSATLKLSSLSDPAGFLDSLSKGSVYFNLHTNAHPNGAMRGQLLLPARIGYAFKLEGNQEIPGVKSDAFGVGVASIDQDGTNIRFAVIAESLSSAFKAAHIHQGSVDANGPVVFDISSTFSQSIAQGVWTNRAATPLTATLAEAFQSGSLYMNVHTVNFPSGEMRGRIADIASAAAFTGLRGSDRKSVYAPEKMMLSNDGRSMRVSGSAAQGLHLRILDARGKSEIEMDLTTGKDGYTESISLAQLKRGFHFALWHQGGEAYRVPFLVR